MPDTPDQVLVSLLAVLFDTEALRSFILQGPQGVEIGRHLPANEPSSRELARRFVAEAMARGIVDRAFFARIEAVRPGQVALIRPTMDLVLENDTMMGTLELPPPEPSPFSPDAVPQARGHRTLMPSPSATLADFDEAATAGFIATDPRPLQGPSGPPVLGLVVRGGFDYLRWVAITPGSRLRIGRGEGCDLTLTDPSCSRSHAEVFQSGEGIFIRDLKSTVGTWVNGQPLKDASWHIHPGDQVRLGNTMLFVEVVDERAGFERVLTQLKRFLPRMSDALKAGFNPDTALSAAQASVAHGVIMLQIDHQADIEAQTDRYRRPVFEAVRAAVIKIAMYRLPDRCSFFQVGPDTLMALVPEAHEERVAYHAEILRRAVEEHPWGCLGPSLKVTVSGVFSRPVPPSQVWPWLEAARAELARLQRSQVVNRFVEVGRG